MKDRFQERKNNLNIDRSEHNKQDHGTVGHQLCCSSGANPTNFEISGSFAFEEAIFGGFVGFGIGSSDSFIAFVAQIFDVRLLDVVNKVGVHVKE